MPRPSTGFDAIGTRWQIDTPEPLPAEVLAAVHARIATFDEDWSRFRDDSWVTHVARSGAGTYDLPADAGPLLDAYDTAARCTDGAVSPLVGASLEALGYDAAYTLRPRTHADGTWQTAAAPSWAEVRRDAGTITLPEPALIDVGAAGKGYLVDLVAGVLTDHGLTEHVVDAGGDLRSALPAEPITIALEDPRDTTRALGVVRLSDGALCGSATNRRAWGAGLHHVVDARTGSPTQDVIAAWALSTGGAATGTGPGAGTGNAGTGSARVADVAATALFFADPDLVAARFDVDYVVLRADGSIRWSLDLDGEVFA
ncbi:MAG TPA: FAD:protein FMN transferase [Cellulomonas sp.]